MTSHIDLAQKIVGAEEIHIDNGEFQVEMAEGYDSYMDSQYSQNRRDRWRYWQDHYQRISNTVGRSIVDIGDQGGGVELIGVTKEDLADGCVNLSQKVDGRTIATHLSELSPVLFHDISLHTVRDAATTFIHHNQKENIQIPSIFAIQSDISRGVSGALRANLDGIDPDLGPGVENLIRALFGHLESLKSTREVGVRSQDKYPGVILGCNLMTLTATIVPLQEKILTILQNEAASKRWSEDERQLVERRFFQFVEEYNNWLTPFWIENWFKKNENGEILIATDHTKEYYEVDHNGVSDEQRIDSERRYKTLDLTVFEALAEKGFEIIQLMDGEWRDEPDHLHRVGAWKIQKKHYS